MLELVAKKSFFRPGPTSRPRLFALGLLVVVLSSLSLTVSAHAAAATAAALELYVHELVNGHRATLGLKPLALIPEISDIARVHSRDMATGRVAFSHVGFDGRGAEISKSIPYRTFAENVAMNYGLRTPGATAVSGWLQSPGHRRNIEGSFDLTGIGIVRSEDGTYFFTQLFMIPSATTAAAPPPTPEPAHSTEAQPPPAEVDAAPSLFAQLAWALFSLAWDLFDLAWELLFDLAWALFAPAPPEPPAPAIAVDPPAVTPAAVPLPSLEPGPSIAAPPSALAVDPPAAPAAVPLPAPEPAHSTVAHPTPIAVDPPPHSGVPALPGPLATPAAALRVPQTYGSRPASNYQPPSRTHRPEKDPRGRPGRRRTTDGWAQKLE